MPSIPALLGQDRCCNRFFIDVLDIFKGCWPTTSFRLPFVTFYAFLLYFAKWSDMIGRYGFIVDQSDIPIGQVCHTQLICHLEHMPLL